jgi:hypothetical protein
MKVVLNIGLKMVVNLRHDQIVGAKIGKHVLIINRGTYLLIVVEKLPFAKGYTTMFFIVYNRDQKVMNLINGDK